MDRIAVQGDLSALVREVATISVATLADGSGHGGRDYREGWINGCANTRLYLHRPGKLLPEIDELEAYSSIQAMIAELMCTTGRYALRQVMVNHLRPGGRLAAHRDGLPDDWRYHLPVETNPRAVWWDEFGGTMHMDTGYWHGPVPYCGVLHAVANNGPTTRIHLVVDFRKD